MTPVDIEQSTADIAAELAGQAGALLPALHALQARFGYIPPESVSVLAKLLNLSRAELHGVVSFYDWFQTEPEGRTTVYICRAEACQAMGSRAVEAAAKAHLGIDYQHSSSDNRVRLQAVYCLGNCACSPCVMVDEKLYSRVTPETITGILDSVKGRDA